MQHIKGTVVLLAGAAAMMAAAYLPPVAERDGVTVQIVGFDETKDREELQVATREADKPFPVEITVSNKGAAAVSGAFKVWMNDDWDVLDAPAGDLAVPAGATRSLKVTARAKASRVLAALYPVHVTYAVPGGEPLHPIAIFKAVLPAKAATAEAVAATRLAKGVTRLVKVPATTWTEVKGKVAPLPDGPTGANFGISAHAAEGVSKNGFLCHPPWKTGAGVEWRDIPLELPAGQSIRFCFALALGRQSATEPPSDGTEHKVFVMEEGKGAKEVFSRVVTSFAWEEGGVDLSPWAGKAITLRLWTGPGPKMNTTCDRCAWGEPVILVGERPVPPTETEWTARAAAAVEAAQAALAFGTDAAKGRFRLDVRGERWGAACALGKMGVFDGVLAFTDGTRTLTYRGFACDVDETTVGAELLDMPCTRAEARAAGTDALEVLHSVEMGDRSMTARVRLWAEKGALKMRWDMPGAVRDEQGNPRYTRLGLGTGTLPAARAYAGFGNVIENPRGFSLGAGGFSLSARHVGADYANGMSLVQAVDVFPDRLVCSRPQNRYAIETHHDATFAFIPSAKGAFAAARAFRDICGYRKSPSWKEAATRMCIDQWGGDYALAAEGLALAGKYGLNESFFVKHVWQRWGYDYRLPEIFPPLGSNEDFLKMRAAAKDAGILFCPHDNYIDFYPDAADYSYDHMVFNRDGTPQRAWYNKGRRALSYRWAPHAFLPWLKANAATLRGAFAPDAIFIDVFTAMAPMDYYDRAGRFYPKTRTQEEWSRAFDTYRALIGSPYGVMVSEAGTDALVGHLDAGQSDHFGAERWMNPEEFDDADRTPWHDMASHGSFVLLAGGLGPRYSAPAWRKSGNERLHGYGSDDYLCNTVIGGRTPMCGGPCNRSTVMTYWLLHDVCKSLALAEFESLDYGANIHQQHSTFSNGGEVWINRATNGVPWTAKECELPAYGFYATVPGARAGIVRIGGQRCAFAETAGRIFVDARPPYDAGRHAEVESCAVSAEIVNPAFCRIATEWTIRKPVTGYVPFVHVVPQNGSEQPIVFQCGMDLSKEMLATVGKHAATISVHLPKTLPAGRYDVRYGAFDPKTGPRLPIRGMGDNSSRIKAGRLTVEKDGDAFARLAWEPSDDEVNDGLELNWKRSLVPFAGVKTDGAFRLEHPAAGDWRIIPLPGSQAFRAALDLGALGASGATVVAVEAIDAEPDADPVEWRQQGTTLDLGADARAFGYRIRFAAK